MYECIWDVTLLFGSLSSYMIIYAHTVLLYWLKCSNIDRFVCVGVWANPGGGRRGKAGWTQRQGNRRTHVNCNH